MREYGKHALYEYHVSHYASRLNGARWSCKKKKEKWLIDSTRRARSSQGHGLSDDPRYHRSFIRVHSRPRQSPARFTQKDRNKVSLHWNRLPYSQTRDARILTAGMRVIVIRDVSSAQDLSNQKRTSLGRRIPWPRCLPYLSFSLPIYLSISVFLCTRRLQTPSRKITATASRVRWHRNRQELDSRPWKMELPAKRTLRPV